MRVIGEEADQAEDAIDGADIVVHADNLAERDGNDNVINGLPGSGGRGEADLTEPGRGGIYHPVVLEAHSVRFGGAATVAAHPR